MKELCPYYQSRKILKAKYTEFQLEVFLRLAAEGKLKSKDFCLAKVIADKNATQIAGHCFRCLSFVIAGKGMGDKLHPGKLNE